MAHGHGHPLPVNPIVKIYVCSLKDFLIFTVTENKNRKVKEGQQFLSWSTGMRD